MRPLLVALSLFAFSASAQWNLTGPYGGTITTLEHARTEEMLLAGTTEGRLFRTTNGTTWDLVGWGTRGANVKQIVISPWDAKRVWIVTNDGLYRSSDRAFSFLKRLDRVLQIAVDPTNPNTVYAVDESYTVKRSFDGGITWETQPGLGPYRTVAVDPFHPNVVWAGTSTQGGGIPGPVSRSDDYGVTWRNVPVAHIQSVTFVRFDPYHENVVYTGANYSGVYRSDDGGATWALQPFYDIAAFDSDAIYTFDNTLVVRRNGAQIYRGYVTALAVNPLHREQLFAGLGLNGGILRSDDRGATWTPANDWLVASETYSITPDPRHPGVAFAGLRGAIARTPDGGETWDAPLPIVVDAPSFEPPSQILRIAFAGNTMYAIDGIALYRSDDDGHTWRRAFRFPFAGSTDTLSDLWIDPRNPSRIWALERGDGFAWTSGKLYRSDDGGDSFTAVFGGGSGTFLFKLTPDPADPDTMYIGGSFNFFRPVLMRTSDGGTTFENLSQPLEKIAGIFSNTLTSVIAVDPSNHDRLWTWITPLGPFRSDDRGATWTRVATGLPDELPFNATSMVFARDRLYLSFVPRNPGPGNPVPETHIVAFDGDRWTDAGEGIYNVNVMMLAADDERLYAATEGAGVGHLLLPIR